MPKKQKAGNSVLNAIETIRATVPGAATRKSPDALEQMLEVLQKADNTVLFQDVPTARECANLARGIFEEARAKYSGTYLAALDFFCDLACFFEPMASVLLMVMEGRFTDALSGSDEAIQRCNQLQQSCTKLAEFPDAKKLVLAVEPSLRPFPALLRGTRISIQAELFGYQGNIEEYLPLLRNAASEYRTVNMLQPSADPAFRKLVQYCSDMADRLESRSHNFEPMLRNVRYMTASGDKVLIIHGRNEGKWRELKDLLKERGREVVVIEEMPDAGAVLIDKCIKYAAECCFAIALFTPDDMVKQGESSVFQARPNVLFELGWFYGRFGPGRVLILKQEGTNVPSDLGGVLTKNFQANVKEVITDIEKELPPPKPLVSAVEGQA
jgi:predicted nucleotide-binding protein